MKLEMTNFRAIAANLVAEGKVCDLAHAETIVGAPPNSSGKGGSSRRGGWRLYALWCLGAYVRQAHQLFRTCHARWLMAAPSQMSSIPSNTPSSHAAETGMLAHR